MATKLADFDAAEYLDSPEAIAAYIQDAIMDDDPRALLDAIGTVARAKGMTEIARETGLGRESLYKSLGKSGDPRISTLAKVCESMGVKLTVEPITSPT